MLHKRGVVSGEFGFVDAEAEVKEFLNRWKDDERPKVRAFVQKRIRDIEQSMAWEQRLAERGVEQRKRDWGEA